MKHESWLKKIPKINGLCSDWWLGVISELFGVMRAFIRSAGLEMSISMFEHQQVSLTTPKKKNLEVLSQESQEKQVVFQQPTHSAELAGRDQLPEYTVRYCKYTRHILSIKWTHLSASLIKSENGGWKVWYLSKSDSWVQQASYKRGWLRPVATHWLWSSTPTSYQVATKKSQIHRICKPPAQQIWCQKSSDASNFTKPHPSGCAKFQYVSTFLSQPKSTKTGCETPGPHRSLSPPTASPQTIGIFGSPFSSWWVFHPTNQPIWKKYAQVQLGSLIFPKKN